MKRTTILIIALGLFLGLATPPNLIAERYNIKKFCKELKEEPSFIFENYFTNFEHCVTYYTNQVKEGCKSNWQSWGFKSVKDLVTSSFHEVSWASAAAVTEMHRSTINRSFDNTRILKIPFLLSKEN